MLLKWLKMEKNVTVSEETARIKPHMWHYNEKQVVHVACLPSETDKVYVKRQLGCGVVKMFQADASLLC